MFCLSTFLIWIRPFCRKSYWFVRGAPRNVREHQITEMQWMARMATQVPIRRRASSYGLFQYLAGRQKPDTLLLEASVTKGMPWDTC